MRRLRRRVRTAGLLVLLAPVTALVAAVPGVARRGPDATSGDRAVPAAVRYVAPVAPLRVVRPFDPPADPYGPGHRGVDLAAGASAAIVAAADGTVTFAGPVAGRGVVVIEHADGIRTEYEPVTPSVHVGAVVGRGQVIGTLAGVHPGCPGACLHWGARRGEAYLDPLSLLRPLGPVRLLPWAESG